MNAFEEYCFGNDYILRFYRVDHGLICTINESMVAELRAVEAKINQQQAEIEALNRFIEERGETGQFIIWKTKQ